MRNVRFGVAIGIAMLASVTALAGPASASTIAGSGTVHCTTFRSRIYNFNPPLVTGGTSSVITYRVSMKATGCTGTGDGATVVSGSGAISSQNNQGNANDCARLTDGNTFVTGPYLHWKVTTGSPKLQKTGTTLFMTGSTGASHLSFAISGFTNSGSFQFDNPTASSDTKQTTAQINAACNGSGLTTLTLIGGPFDLA
jgi:hypothetical protein